MPTTSSNGASRSATIMLLVLTSSFVVPVAVAVCECGYQSQVDVLNSQFTYTDLIESDFLHIRDVSLSTDWRRQSFMKTPAAGRGPYGYVLFALNLLVCDSCSFAPFIMVQKSDIHLSMNFTIGNVASNSISDHYNWTGPGRHGGDPGVNLVVKGGIPPDAYVDIGQLDSIRTDLLWGSYRASLKLPSINGTCSAFFWVGETKHSVFALTNSIQYFNDSQEIDMEFLSHQYDFEKNIFPVNLVLQTPKSASQGFSEKGPNNFVLANLTFNPTTAFHEYRIDFVPGKVVFFADGQTLAIMDTTLIPTEAGHMILSHWSNGNEYWSKGPPTEDAKMTVAYVKAYFNSSEPERQKRHASSCQGSTKPDALCIIPHQMRAPDPRAMIDNRSAAEVPFFTDNPDLAKGQIYYEKSGVTVLKLSVSESLMAMMVLSVVAAVFF